MASVSAENASTIVVSCKQTRFHIADPVYQELNIEDLNITVKTVASKDAPKPKGKSRAEGLEILAHATLKLNAGIHYALIGRNGSGKSTLLRAISEKLIPGIPLKTRISSLQQTAVVEEATSQTDSNIHESSLSVLEEVIDKATSRSIIQKEIEILQPAVDNPQNAFSSLRALRQVQHGRLQRQLFEDDKNATLRSGARGWNARKVLIASEKAVAASAKRLQQEDEEIDDTTLREETNAAVDLLTELQSQVEPTRMAEIEVNARKILAGLGFPKGHLDLKGSTLSGGWRMRMHLASALLQPGDILILDEPTNFLDMLGIIWLERHLINLRDSGPNPPTVILVSHDRDFVNSVCQELIILRDQVLTYFKGNLITYEASIRDKKLYLGRMKEAQEKQKAHMQETINRNIKQGLASGDDNKLKQAKSRQKKLDDRMGMQVSAKGGRFKLNRDLVGYHTSSRAEIEVPVDEKSVHISLPPAPDLRFPGPLVSLDKVTYKYPVLKKGDPPTPVILQDVDLTVYTGDRIGILGLNGSGKSTLIGLLVDTLKPAKGTVTRHPRLRLGYYSQHAIEELKVLGRGNPELTALSLLTKDVAGELDEGEVRGLLGSLGLPGRTASDVPLAKLSGGQLVRMALARLLWKLPQLLVLDEITTHLDYYTITALADALNGWDGAVVLVSHDRYMMKRVIEGLKDDDDEDGEESGEDEEEEGANRRRVMYLLRKKEFTVLENGVEGYEERLEKQVEKLMRS